MNKPKNKRLMAIATFLLLTFFIAAPALAQSPGATTTNDNRSDATRALGFSPRLRLWLTPAGFRLRSSANSSANPGSGASTINLTPMAGGNLQVLGGGTLGRLTKWTGFTSSNSFIGNSTIFEDKYGLVGIGTDTPTSKLTVAGMIETTMGGLKFPDGTVQTTSAAGALFSVAHDATLQGNGTSATPLGVAVPLILSGDGDGFAVIQVNAIGTNPGSTGVRASSTNGIGVDGSGGSVGVSGFANETGVVGRGGFAGVVGEGRLTGVVGRGFFDSSAPGVQGEGGNGSDLGPPGPGVFGRGGSSGIAGQNSGVGLFGAGGNGFNGSNGGSGVFGRGGLGGNGGTDGLAGEFDGDVEIGGDLNVTGTKNFKIDHPLDPENKYLYHAAIESSEVLNVYSGNVATNEHGDAIVTLPDWFEAINRDFRYQLTVVGTFAQAIVLEKVKNNRFAIKTNAPNVEVSWQVTGIRSDRAMRSHPFIAEADKPEQERGTYLNPEAFGQPEERGVEWTRNPELMRQMKDARAKQIEGMKQKAHGDYR